MVVQIGAVIQPITAAALTAGRDDGHRQREARIAAG